MTTTTRPRMAVKNQASAPEYGAEVLIYGFIGDWWTGMDADTFVRQIESISADAILVRMHSLGGDVWDGIAIMNALKRHSAKVTVVVEGIAASMASAIAVGGSDELIMAPHSQMMIHDARYSWLAGNAEELQKAAADLDRESQNLAEVYAARAGTPVEEWRAAMKEETWFTAKEAVATGLAHSIGLVGITESSAEPATIQDVEDPRILASLRYRGRDAAPPPPSRLMPPQEDPTMKLADKITAKLRTTNATESQILAALDEALGISPNAETPQPSAAEETPPAGSLELTDEETTELLDLAGLEGGATAREILDALAELITAPDADDPQDSALTTPVDKETLAELRQLAAEGIVARADNQNRARAELVEKAIRENRISAKSRARWVKALSDSPESAEKELLAIPVDTIPRAELGHNREDHTDIPSTESAAIIAAFHS